ncbi:hypothetical protein [Castellaniella sp.]|uniref:hypothetical protein n=1 Tax=Castellaniella sp. TaxID=1955812 RepID=UPI002AFF2209|nr:hypothetical protein [Castellaniella sp.]
MGWMYSPSWRTKQELVAHLAENRGGKCTVIKHSTVGNHWWAVFEWKETGRRFIVLCLLSSGREDGWGYKDMDESMGPFYYDCPLGFLKIAGEPANNNAKLWREKVIEYHANKARIRAAKPSVGDVLEVYGVEYRLTTNVGRRGWNARRVSDGVGPYRLTCAQVNQAVATKLALA